MSNCVGRIRRIDVECLSNCSELCRVMATCVDCMSSACRIYVEVCRIMSNLCRIYVEFISRVCRTVSNYVELMSNVGRKYVEFMSNLCRTHKCRPGACRVLVEYMSNSCGWWAGKILVTEPEHIPRGTCNARTGGSRTTARARTRPAGAPRWAAPVTIHILRYIYVSLLHLCVCMHTCK